MNKKQELRRIGFVGNAKKELMLLDKTSRNQLGFQLFQLQKGREPDDFKSMTSVGKGVFEIRVRDENNKNKVRCFYVTKFKESIIVLHVFVKETQKTPTFNIEIGKKRYQDLIKEIREIK